LCGALKDTVKKEQIPNVAVLGIPGGGVITSGIVEGSCLP